MAAVTGVQEYLVLATRVAPAEVVLGVMQEMVGIAALTIEMLMQALAVLAVAVAVVVKDVSAALEVVALVF